MEDILEGHLEETHCADNVDDRDQQGPPEHWGGPCERVRLWRAARVPRHPRVLPVAVLRHVPRGGRRLQGEPNGAAELLAAAPALARQGSPRLMRAYCCLHQSRCDREAFWRRCRQCEEGLPGGLPVALAFAAQDCRRRGVHGLEQDGFWHQGPARRGQGAPPRPQQDSCAEHVPCCRARGGCRCAERVPELWGVCAAPRAAQGAHGADAPRVLTPNHARHPGLPSQQRAGGGEQRVRRGLLPPRADVARPQPLCRAIRPPAPPSARRGLCAHGRPHPHRVCAPPEAPPRHQEYAKH